MTTTGTLHGTYHKADGTPLTGKVYIAPSVAVVRDETGNVILSGTSHVDLDNTGSFSVTLVASDDLTLDPSGVTYTVRLRGLPAVTGVAIPGGTTVDMADVTPVDPAAPAYAVNGVISVAGLVGSVTAADLATALDGNGLASDVALANEVTRATGVEGLKAPIASPTFTGTVGGITKSMVGLGNVDNTSDLNKPVSTAQQTAINTAIANLVAGAPGALDTLLELANQFATDESAATALTSLVGQIRNLSDATFLAGLTASFAPKWKPSTAYTAGDVVQAPDGSIVKRLSSGTSGLSYTSTNWQTVATVVGTQAQTELAAMTTAAIKAREVAPKLYYLDAYSTLLPDPTWVWQAGQSTTATTASAGSAAGATTVTLTSVTGLSAGVILVAGAGTANQQIKKIASVAGSVVTLTTALDFAISNGDTVSPLWADDRHFGTEGWKVFARFIAQAKDASGNFIITGTNPKVAILGDSWIARGATQYATQLQARIPGATVVNAGVEGDKSDQLVARFGTDVPSDSTYVVINEPGVNDTTNSYTAATMATNLETLWRKARAIGATLVFTGIPAFQAAAATAAARDADLDTILGDGSSFPNVTPAGLTPLAGSPVRSFNTSDTAAGTGALGATPTGVKNTAFGYNTALALSTGQSNTAIGYAALADATTVDQNTAVGALALRFNTAAQNTAVGNSAFAANIGGTGNTGLGYFAGTANTSGTGNTAVGWSALAANVTAIRNTAVGNSALILSTTDGNSAFGFGALASQTTGTGNTALGCQAGFSVNNNTGKATTTEINQTIIGYQSGGQASAIVAVGYRSEASGTGAIALGAQTSATASGSVAIGRDSGGTGASTSTTNEIALGTANHLVKIAGKLTTAASTTTQAGLVVPHGTAPTSPTDGAVWTTTAGMFVRVNGVTKTVTLT